jgi:hypothetical protein
MTKLRNFLIGTVVITGVTSLLVIQHQARVKLRENDAVLRQQDDHLAELTAEYRRLSNLVTQADNSRANDHTTELTKLRCEAEALRRQTNELGNLLKENRQSKRWPDSSTGSNGSSSDSLGVVSDSNSEEYRHELFKMAASNNLTAAGILGSAINKYAREHQQQLPTDFDQAATDIYKSQAENSKRVEQLIKRKQLEPFTDSKHAEAIRTGDFEIVFQGSLSEITHVPPSTVALIRERQAWRTPSGKRARIYWMAGGGAKVVESDDNFQSWEAEHVIPPRAK